MIILDLAACMCMITQENTAQQHQLKTRSVLVKNPILGLVFQNRHCFLFLFLAPVARVVSSIFVPEVPDLEAETQEKFD